jgi:hypothetical protein
MALRRKPPIITTVIDGQQHIVTEWARKRAALNMLADPAVKARVVALIGEEKAREHYPEAWPTWWDQVVAWVRRGLGR